MMPVPTGSVAPFDGQPGVWLRCQLHCHTTETDGWLPPIAQRRAHAWAGYDVLVITDHDVVTATPAAVGQDDLLLFGGVEISLIGPRSRAQLHLLGLGVESMPEVSRDASLREAALAVRAAGGLPFVAHPTWSGLLMEELDGLDVCAGIEVFNASCDVEQSRGDSSVYLDAWLTMGHRLTAIATDDSHYPGWDSHQAWTMVHAREKSRAAVLEALETGRFYASAGPRILDLRVEGGEVHVRTTPAVRIAALSNPTFGGQLSAGSDPLTYRGARLRTADGQIREGVSRGELLTGGVFPIPERAAYVRLLVTDEQGRSAWSNPIWSD
jgi:hypothetical protein